MQAQMQATFTRRMQTKGTRDMQVQSNSTFKMGQVMLRLLAFVFAFALSPVHMCGVNANVSANARKNACALTQCKRTCRLKEWKIFHSLCLHLHLHLHLCLTVHMRYSLRLRLLLHLQCTCEPGQEYCRYLHDKVR